MTIDETRQLGIEFERRVQTMIPQKEIAEKLDSETIFSFLNQYQDKYIHDIYRSLDMIPEGSKISAHVESVLQALLKETDVDINATGVVNNTSSVTDPNGVVIADSGRSVIYPLPEQFYLYIRSISKVSSTFSFKQAPTSANDQNNSTIRVIPNQLVSQNDVWKLIETPHDSLRILRRPAAVLSKYTDNTKQPTITVIYDQYTTPLGIKVMYYAEPAHFDVLTNTACELPMDVFDDLVTGAVDLYVQYVAGAEANRRRQIEQAQQQQRQQNRRNNEED